MHCILFENKHKKLCINVAFKLHKFIYNEYNVVACKKTSKSKALFKAIVKNFCCNIIPWTLKKILFKSIKYNGRPLAMNVIICYVFS